MRNKKGNIFARRFLRVLDSTVDLFLLVVFLLFVAAGTYAMWDTHQVYAAAESNQYATYKPTEDDSLSFEQLQRINPEVFGWITVFNTQIDYPLTQTTDNEKYINTNAKGEYSMSGSIFLDYRNHSDFSDFANIVYGHHMEHKAMFGELSEFRDSAFFTEHQYGNLYYGGKNYGLEFFAFAEVDGYDTTIYSLAVNQNDSERESFLEYLRTKSVNTRSIDVGVSDRLIILSTCSSGETNGRNLLVGRITDETFPAPETTEDRNHISGVDQQNSLWDFVQEHATLIVVLGLCLLIALLLLGLRLNKKRGKER